MSAINCRSRLYALDGLRGAAILGVFFYHYAGGFVHHASSTGLRIASVFFAVGWSGVDLFFVLSGFLITGILYDTQNDPHYYKTFYVRRALRIFPIYYLAIVLALACTHLIDAHWKTAHLFFLVYMGYPAAIIWPSIIYFSPVVLVSHLWSLSMEEQFYMVWPWIVARLRAPRLILRACAIAVIIALLLRILVRATGGDGAWSYAFLLCRMDQLAIGAALAMLVRGSHKDLVTRLAWPVLGASLLTFAASCLVRRGVDHNDPALNIIAYTLTGLIYGSVLILSLQAGTMLHRFFSAPILRTFGKYSYGLYLYHFPLTVLLGPLRERLASATQSVLIGGALYLSICITVNLLVAMASFHIIEAPIMRLKDRFQYSEGGESLPPSEPQRNGENEPRRGVLVSSAKVTAEEAPEISISRTVRQTPA